MVRTSVRRCAMRASAASAAFHLVARFAPSRSQDTNRITNLVTNDEMPNMRFIHQSIDLSSNECMSKAWTNGWTKLLSQTTKSVKGEIHGC